MTSARMDAQKNKPLLGADSEDVDSTQIILDSPAPSEGSLPQAGSKKQRKARHAGEARKVTLMTLVRDKRNRSALFVLFVLLITYMFSQVDRYLQAITASNMQRDQDWGTGDGTGTQEDLLVGAVFTVVYLPSGIPFGFLADRYSEHKKYILFAAFLSWSLATVATGFSTVYWQVVVFRFVLAIGESACTPLAGSIISDHFSKEARTTALGVYNWGIYTGYSLAYGVANALTELTSWRTVWWAFGAGGCVWSLLVLLIPAPHTSRKRSGNVRKASGSQLPPGQPQQKASVWQIVKYFSATPSLVILLIASLIRNAGGYVWAYNSKNFFELVDGQTGEQQAIPMQFIPLVCGCLGALLGGFISDHYVKKSQPWKRLLILVASNLCAAPFAFLALWLPAPWCYLMLIPSNVIGEMWVGICIALVIELVPKAMKTTALSIYFFWIGIAGFFPLLVTPLQTAFCGLSESRASDCNEGFRWALIVLFPGLYVLSSAIFTISMLFLRRDQARAVARPAIRLQSGH